MNLRHAVLRGFKANLFWGATYSLMSGLMSYALIRILPAKDFAAYASAAAAGSLGVVLVEGGLAVGFTRHLPAATKEGVALSLYDFVLKRRVMMGFVGLAGFALWAASGLGHHALLDGYVGRWVWLCIGLMFFGELFSLLPFLGLQALFEYQYSLSTRAVSVVVRGALMIGAWFWLKNLSIVLLIHGTCAILEGCSYHWLIRGRLSGRGELPAELRQKVVNFGYFSIAEKGAHAVGGINGIFLILGYLLPVPAMAPIAIGKELAQRMFALVVLPINNLTAGVLNWSTDSSELPKIASRSLAIVGSYVLLVASLALGLVNSVLPALNLARDEAAMACTVVIFSGIAVEYVLRYDQSYRFRRGQMREAVIWAYASAIAAVGLSFFMSRHGGAVALMAYFTGRLLVLACAVAYKLDDRYSPEMLKWLPAKLAAFAVTMAALLWRLDAYWHWVPILMMLAVAAAFYRENREWLGLGRLVRQGESA